MSVAASAGSLARLASFATGADIPAAARSAAARAFIDTIGVTLAGAFEPAGRIVQEIVAADGGHACTVVGTQVRASAGGAALANGTAAHALDYDDMCFVSLAHPSAPLVAAVLGWLFDGFEIGMFPLAGRPALTELLGNDKAAVDQWFGVITAVFLVGAASGGVFFGWLGDRLGRVRAMSLSIFTYAVFTGLCGFADAAWQTMAL